MSNHPKKLHNVDLKRLQIFMKIVECGGFSAAEDKLNLSAASISIQMSALEKHLDTVLCIRGRAGFSLTPEGEKIHEACQALMLAHDNFNSSLATAKGQLTGELKLGVIDNIIFDPELQIHLVLHEFRQLAPEVQISLLTLSPSELERAILEQRIHLAIGVYYQRIKDLNYYHFCNERLTLYCSNKHIFHNSTKLSIEDLHQAAFVERTYGATLKYVNRPINLQPSAYSSSLEATLILILSGQYIGFLPQYYAHQWVKQNLIKALLADQIHINSEVSLVTHKNPTNLVMTKTLLDLILQNHEEKHD